jgi:predicted site-specific integrase-resolvase
MENEFVNSKIAKQMLGVSSKTLRVWDKENKIGTTRIPSGARRYNLKDIKNIIGSDPSVIQKRKICYCRVSSPKQSDDLERQKNFFRQQYPDHELVTDVGSGINWKRKGLQTILDGAMQRNISEVVVAHRDRLCRFAFDLLEWIFSRLGVQLLVLDKNEGESPDTELTDDILSIIHVYSCRKMGRRRYNKSKKDKILSEPISEEDTETVDGN